MKLSSYKILAADVIDANTAKVIARITQNGLRDEIKSMNTAFAKQRLSIVAGSARVVAQDADFAIVACTVVPENGAMEASVVNKARMIALATDGQDNMFMDANDNVWEELNGKLVRRNQFESEASLLKVISSYTATASVRERHMAVAAAKNYTAEIESGNYCLYVDGTVLADGYIVACDDESGTALVLPRPDNVSEPYPHRTVNYGNIVEAFDWSNVVEEVPGTGDDQRLTATAGALDLEDALDYYKKIYGYNADFWNQWQARLKERGIY